MTDCRLAPGRMGDASGNNEVTVFAESTLQAIPGITDTSQDGYHDINLEPDDTGQGAPMWDLTNTNRVSRAPLSLEPRQGEGGRHKGAR